MAQHQHYYTTTSNLRSIPADTSCSVLRNACKLWPGDFQATHRVETPINSVKTSCHLSESAASLREMPAATSDGWYGKPITKARLDLAVPIGSDLQCCVKRDEATLLHAPTATPDCVSLRCTSSFVVSKSASHLHRPRTRSINPRGHELWMLCAWHECLGGIKCLERGKLMVRKSQRGKGIR